MDVGDILRGTLTHDGEEHYSFLEDSSQTKASSQRNPLVCLGKFVNVHQRNDGTLYPTFNRPHFTKEFAFQDFCREAAAELLMEAGIVGKKDSKR